MQTQFVDLYRNGIKSAADAAKISLENTIRMHEKQLQIVRGLLEEQSRSTDEIAQAGSVQELLALQSRMASAQLGRMVELWSSFWQTAAQNQTQGIREWQAFTRSSEDVARSAANQVSRAAGSVAESVDAANHERKGQRKSA